MFKVTIDNQTLFRKKVLAVFIGTLVLVPLIQAKQTMPASLYIIGLLAIHITFLIIYLLKIPFKQWASNKRFLLIRLLAIIFFAYLLSLIKFTYGLSTLVIISHLIAALLLHILILLLFMTHFSTKIKTG